jgi:hypothetical protein
MSKMTKDEELRILKRENALLIENIAEANEKIRKLEALIVQQRRLIEIHETFATTTPNAGAVQP